MSRIILRLFNLLRVLVTWSSWYPPQVLINNFVILSIYKAGYLVGYEWWEAVFWDKTSWITLFQTSIFEVFVIKSFDYWTFKQSFRRGRFVFVHFLVAHLMRFLFTLCRFLIAEVWLMTLVLWVCICMLAGHSWIISLLVMCWIF